MSEEEYLWDGSGEPPPEVAHLEDVLAGLRWSGRRPDLSRAGPGRQWLDNRSRFVAAAAALVVLVLGGMFLLQRTAIGPPLTSWQLSRAGRHPSSVRSGQLIETGLVGALMQSELIGEVRIDPHSRLRLLATQRDRHRLALDRGTIHAFIWALPARFVVDTPAAKAVDLGCEYTLSVANDGAGFLTVEMGWVAFQSKGVESFIPQGAACATRPGHGPDTPYFLDAPRALTKSLAEFDLSGNEHALRSVLAAARPRDALTLWHLLERTHGQERAEVFDRFAELVDLPSGVTREGVLRGDRSSLDAAWDALRLGNTSWWREWQRNW
jgi:hypothetical protein